MGALFASTVVLSRDAEAQTITEIIPEAVAGFFGEVEVDSNDNVFLSTGPSNTVLKRDPGGSITTILDADGPPGPATFAGGSGVALGPLDSVFVVGLLSYNLIEITAAGDLTEILDANGDGLGHAYFLPLDVAVDGSGNAFTTGGDGLFKITPDGTKSFVLEDGGASPISGMRRVAADGAGNVYVSGSISNNVVKITPTGVASVIIDASGDGLGNVLTMPEGIDVDTLGNVYVSARGSHNAFEITASGEISEIIDSTGDGSSPLVDAYGIAVAADRSVYVAGYGSDNVFRVEPGGVITRILDASGDGAGAMLDGPSSIAINPSADRVYVGGAFSRNVFEIALAPAVPALSPLAVLAAGMGMLAASAWLSHRGRRGLSRT